jgi:hypothetical protein
VNGGDRVTRWSTAFAVLGVAAVPRWRPTSMPTTLCGRTVRQAGLLACSPARLLPLTVDGPIYASSMVMLDSARRRTPVPALARWLLGVGIAATLAANVAHGLGHALTGAAVAAWPAVVLVGSYELPMMVIRSSQIPADCTPDTEHNADPLQEQAAELFAEQLAADRVPSMHAIRAQLHVGQPRARRLGGKERRSRPRRVADDNAGTEPVESLCCAARRTRRPQTLAIREARTLPQEAN